MRSLLKHKALLAAAAASLLTAVVVAQAQVPGVNSTLNSVFTLAYDNSTMKPTFSAAKIITLGSNTSDVCLLIGSATKSVRLRRVILAGVTGAIMSDPVLILKRSTLNVGGAGSITTNASYDSSNATSTAVAETMTTDPALLGTLAATLLEQSFTFNNNTTGVVAPTTYTFGQLGQPVVLRSAAQSVAVNFAGASFTSATLSCTLEWTEE